MFVAWNPGPAEPPPGVETNTVPLDERHTALQVDDVNYMWNAANQWRIPTVDIPDTAWPILPMVGGLSLVGDDGTPVGDGTLPATRPDAP